MDIEAVDSYRYLGVHLNNRLDWTHNSDALYRKGQSRLYLLRRLRSFGVEGPLLKKFYDSVVASAIFYGVVCWGGSISAGDRKRLNRVIRRASSVLGCPLDPVEVVELELRAQVGLFVELNGHLPEHMDGHQHVHVLPEVREVFAKVVSDLRIPYTRVPVEPGLYSCPWIPAHLHKFYKQVEKDALDAIPVFRRHGIRWPDVYLGLTTMGQNMSIPSLHRALSYALAANPSSSTSSSVQGSHQPVVTAELMVHPGYPSHPKEGGCGEGPDDFSQSADRQHELSVLKDPSVLALYCQERVQLCAFRDL
uniref:Carbohydrate deacetylase n=1 Tax=Astatotilapia calliptera TaxID=8154 RepID=A0AAX7TRP8_ASTCA